MLEDDFYRSSTQYRHWSFTPAQLAKQRSITNSHAADRVCVAFQRARGNDPARDEDGADQVDTLTTDEEQKIIEWGSNNIIELGKRLNMSHPVVATGIQYLRRFYLMNSPMTYHPKAIQVCALWLAVKSCHVPPSTRQFMDQADITEDELKSPEFLLLQGNKFTLDVRHPFKGLDGGSIEIRELLADGKLLPSEKNADTRVTAAIDKATNYLRREAQLTDVYFLFTPAQIWLAALHLADAELTTAYLATKFDTLLASDPPPPTPEADLRAIQAKLTVTVQKCAEVLASYKSPEQDKKERKEIGRIGRKLAKCQDPEKVDIVAVAKAKRAEKREGSESEREGEKKKRKTEREGLGSDGDVFGGSLKDVNK